MNNKNTTELVLVTLFVSFVIYMDRGTFLGGLGDILAIFTIIYTWLNLVRNERLEKIEAILRKKTEEERDDNLKGGKG